MAAANSMEEVGRMLLQSNGCVEPTDEQIKQAIMANDRFLQELQSICDSTLQFEEELTNSNAQELN
jgi:hypothetical protein